MPKQVLLLLILLHSLMAFSYPIPKNLQTKIDQMGLHGVDMVASKKNVLLLISFCDTSTNNLVLPNFYFENLLALQYNFVQKNNLQEYQLKLAYPLASIYHDQSKFEKELPILVYLYKNLSKFEELTQKYILVNLEQVYRSENEIGKAIEVRKERLRKGYVKTIWELYRDCDMFNDALYDFRINQPLPKKNDIFILNYYSYYGDLFFEANEIDSAIKYYKIGLDNANTILAHLPSSQPVEMIEVTYWRGDFTGSLGKCNMAKGYYGKAIQPLLFALASNKNSPENKTYIWLLLSESYLEINNIGKSKVYYDSAKNDMIGKTNKRDMVQLLKLSTKYYNKINKNDSALYFSQKYISYITTKHANVQKNQLLLNIGKLELKKNRDDLEASKSSLLLSTKTAKYQEDNLLFSFFLLFTTIIIGILLYQNNVAKTKSNTIIQQEVLRNDTLLKELHHRVKNNLQSMYSLLNMQKRRNVNETTLNILTSVQNRIQTMALVHQNLYTTDNFEFVEVKSYIYSLVNHLKTIYQFDDTIINVEFDIPTDLKLPIEQIISLGLIINEVVSNSFKYAFKNQPNGSLIVKVTELNNKVQVEVKDNGVGIAKDQINEDQLGMKLIRLMSEQLKAEHTFSGHSGVTHCFKFKTMNISSKTTSDSL